MKRDFFVHFLFFLLSGSLKYSHVFLTQVPCGRGYYAYAPMQHASRKKTRKFLLQKLYARIYGNIDEQKFFDSYFEGIMDFQADTQYMQEMFDTIVSHQKEILFIIEKYAPKFDIETMLKTNILALCIAIAEMLYLKEEIPAKVSINEAIELSKYFGDESSKNVVNGILNSFFEHITEHMDSDKKSLSPHHFFL